MLLLGALLLTLLVTGCRGSGFTLDRLEQPAVTASVDLPAGPTLGQTFKTPFAGLAAIEVFLQPLQAGSSEVRLSLWESPARQTRLGQARLPLAALDSPGFHPFIFSAPVGKAHQSYYFEIELLGDGAVQAGLAGGEAYRNGALYLNRAPQDSQMAFGLAFAPGQAAAGLGREALGWLATLAAGAWLFLLPGWGLGSWLLDERRKGGTFPAESAAERMAWDWGTLDWGAKAGLAAGFSLALYPLLLLWADVFGLTPGPTLAWLPPAGGLALIAWQRGRSWTAARVAGSQKTAGAGPPAENARRPMDLAGLLLLLALGLIFAARFWAVRGLEAPMWGDSVQHAVMAQLIAEQGGLFRSWLPYTPYQTLTVQFGFAAFTTLQMWTLGTGSLAATLATGQLINGLAALALYPLAVRLAGGRRWAGVGAVLSAGLLSSLPAFYVNWGRYAQLAGLAILPAALWVSIELTAYAARPLHRTRTGLAGRVFLAGMSVAGMALTYYRMPFFYATFLLVWLPAAFLEWRLPPGRWIRPLGALALGGVISLALFLPWAPRLLGSSLAASVETGVVAGSQLDFVRSDLRTWLPLSQYAPVYLLALAAGGALLALVQRRWTAAAVALWFPALAAYSAGQLLHLPGANMLQSFSTAIALYLPVALLAGRLPGALADRLESGRAARLGLPALAFALALAALWGADQVRRVANPPVYALVAAPDLQAADWIREHIPPEAVFLVQGFTVYDGWSAVGADAGWWLPLIAGRANTMPPQYALLNEQPIQKNYTQDVVALVTQLQEQPLDAPESREALCRMGVTHLYIGQGQGQVGLNAQALFSPEEALDSPFLTPLYHLDRVQVFALNPAACEGGP